MIVNCEVLKKVLQAILLNHGVDASDASIIADVLVEGDLKGYPSHGSVRIFQILEGITKGTLKVQAHPNVIKENLSVTIFDCKKCIGHPVAKQSMLLAVEKAKRTGVGICGIVNAGHIGMLSYYSELASNFGCVGLVMCSSSPISVIKGGVEKTFGTNPISYSFPTGSMPITADFSTSKVSRSTLKKYYKQQKSMPLGWAVDKQGAETTNPADVLFYKDGGLQTIDGDIKGSMLSMMISVLAGQLIGGVMNPEVVGSTNMNDESNKGDLFVALNIDDFSDRESFNDKNDALVNFINRQQADFRMPGYNAYISKKKREKNGVEISDEIAELLEKFNY